MKLLEAMFKICEASSDVGQCHAFTVAMDKIFGGWGEAFAFMNDEGDVSHSAYRVPRTQIFVDEGGVVDLDDMESRVSSAAGASWRPVPIEQVKKWATGKNMMSQAKVVVHRLESEGII